MSNASPTIPVTINWRNLSAAEARAAWDDLTEWVDWLVNRYRLPVGVVPTCWVGHGPHVEELSALHTAWVAAYVVATRSPTAGVEWHSQFDHARRRLAHWTTADAGSCAGGRTHTAHQQRPADSSKRTATVPADMAAE